MDNRQSQLSGPEAPERQGGMDDHSPGFTCPDCSRSVGARKSSEASPWEPLPCLRCSDKARRQKATQLRRVNPRALGGVDVDAAVAWMLTLPVFAELIPKRLKGRKLRVDVGHCGSGSVGGRAWYYEFRIRVYGGPRSTAESVLEVALHELVHIATPRAGHRERYRRVLQRAVREAWDVDVPLDVERGDEDNKAYAMDRLIRASLQAKTDLHTFPAKPAEPKPRVTSQALVEKRALHAATMLARAERKLKLAKTIQQRWAKKVSYYERVAAKRGGS